MGPGWIVQITGYHYHNADPRDYGAEYVRSTLMENLRNKKVKLSSSEPGTAEEVSMAELGITQSGPGVGAETRIGRLGQPQR